MSPRFDRNRDQDKGSGAAGARPGRPARRPFSPRGEWRPDRSEGGDRGGAGARPSFGRRPERGDRPERGNRAGRPGDRFSDRSAGRPSDRFSDRSSDRFSDRSGGGQRRFDGPRAEYGRSDRPRGEGGRSEGPRFEGARFEGSRGTGSRSERRPGRPQGRPSFQDRRSDRRPQGRSWSPDRDRENQSKPLIVDAPSGEAERFNAGPSDDLIWGRHAAQAALESDRPIHRIWCTPEMRFQPRFMQLLREAKAGGVLVEEVTWSRLGQLTDGAVHQGIVMQAAAADTLDLGTLIDGCRNLGEPPLLMALDGITDPHNLGAIVRSAEALGAHGLVLPQRRSAGLTGSVAKVAAGALEHLPVARVVNLNRSLETLKEEGYRVIGLAGEAGVALSEADLDGPLVIVTGSEGSGLSMLTRKHCDQLVRIPLRGATPSLNASVATAMVLYEVARRGWMKQITGSAPAPRIVRPQLPAPAVLDRSLSSEAPVEPERNIDAFAEEPQEFSAEQAEAAERLVADVIAELNATQASESSVDSQPLIDTSTEPFTEASTDPSTEASAPELVLGLAPQAKAPFSGDIQL